MFVPSRRLHLCRDGEAKKKRVIHTTTSQLHITMPPSSSPGAASGTAAAIRGSVDPFDDNPNTTRGPGGCCGACYLFSNFDSFFDAHCDSFNDSMKRCLRTRHYSCSKMSKKNDTFLTHYLTHYLTCILTRTTIFSPRVSRNNQSWTKASYLSI